MLSFLPLICWNLSPFTFPQHRPHFLLNFLKGPFSQEPCHRSHIAVLCHTPRLLGALAATPSHGPTPLNSSTLFPKPLLHFCVFVNSSTHFLVSGKLHSASCPESASRSFGCHVSLGALQGAEFACVRRAVGGLSHPPTSSVGLTAAEKTCAQCPKSTSIFLRLLRIGSSVPSRWLKTTWRMQK